MTDAIAPATLQLLFGRGLAADPLFPGLDIGCDLALEAGPSGTRLAEHAGVDNLAQALRLALTTAYGVLPFDRDYGFDGINALATETDARMQQERIRIAVAQTVQRDPRVRRVTDVQVTTSAPGSRTLAVSVTFDTTASAGLTMTIEGIPSGD